MSTEIKESIISHVFMSDAFIVNTVYKPDASQDRLQNE